MKKFRFKAEYFLYKFFKFLSKILPLNFFQFLGKMTGIFFGIVTNRIKIILKNLNLIFPNLNFFKKFKIMIKCMAFFGRATFEYIKISQEPKLIEKKIKIIGIENLKKALESGKGTFLVSAHFGNWELAALALSKIGFRQGLVHRPLDNPFLEKEFSKMRTAYGNWLIEKKGALKKIVKDLKEGNIIDILIDQKVKEEIAHEVIFLGVKTFMISSLAKLVKYTSCPVIFAFSYPEKSGYRFIIEEPIYYNGENERDLTQKYADILTEKILKTPHLWLLHHDRF